jgi:single-strand DNA-binding protein
MNTITIIGNLGSDPEMRFTDKGLAQVKFSVATTYGKDDNKKTTWHNCVAWGDQAEAIAGTFIKGMRVIVIGRYDTREYTDRSGEKKKTTEITVDDCGSSLRWGMPKEAGKFSAPAKAPAPQYTQQQFNDEEPF